MTPSTDALRAEINHLRSLLLLTRTRYSFLLAAARATIGADRDGEPDPLYYLRDELTANPSMPPLTEDSTSHEDRQ